MSQRGGSVVTYVRYGDKVYSPLSTRGRRTSSSPSSCWRPPALGLAKYPENLVEKMQAKGIQVDAMDCLALAEQAGSSKAVNMVLMGRLSHYFPDIPPEAWQASPEANVPPKVLDLNKVAFALGQQG